MFLKAGVTLIQKLEQCSARGYTGKQHATYTRQTFLNQSKKHSIEDYTAQLSSIYTDIKGGLTSEKLLI